MQRPLLLRWLRDISIAKKLYFTVGLMALLIATELMILMFAIHTLSAVRTYVGAEGLWSKAQKDAAYSLQKYGRTRDEKDFQTYLHFLRVPLGDRKARLELLKPEPDMEVVRQGYLEGRIHPNDIEGAVNLFRRFNQVSYISKAIEVWTTGDRLIAEMTAIGDSLHSAITAPVPSDARVNMLLQQLDPLNDRLTVLEDEFSYTLGEGSRWLADLILKLLFGIVLTVEISGLTITILVSRGIEKGLNEIISSSEKIAEGDYSVRAQVFSRDEIGTLARSFNDMTGRLGQNITALKQSEEALVQAKEIVEQSAHIKENFLANMSHEIRTPMNAVIGFTGLLADTDLDVRQRQFVRAIQISSQSLMTIINDILDYSKIESGMIVIEKVPFRISETFASLKVLLHQKAAEKALELRFHCDPRIPRVVLGDPTRLMQILLNLTDNALKFTERGYISVSAELHTETPEVTTVAFEIKDTGKGIAEDKLALIFERFTQETAETTRRYGGTGLGLSISKSFVALQGGSISVESEAGKGSVFTFVIPYEVGEEQTQQQANVRAEDRPPEKRSLQILVAEDNKLNQSLAQFVLGGFGHKVEIAENGRIAVDMLQEGSYDLILMDMQMPEMDGYEATRHIREALKLDIPIIALTAHAMSEEREKCIALGMNDYISKPFDPKELEAKINSLFAQA